MKLSVIVYSKNNQNDIYKCIQTIRGQTFKREEVEVIMIDDASKDNTPNLIAGYESKYDVIPMLKNIETSLADCVNEAFEKCTGEYLYVIRACDIVSHLQFFDVAITALDRNPGCSTYSGLTRVHDSRGMFLRTEGMIEGKDGTSERYVTTRLGLRGHKIVEGGTFFEGFLKGWNEASERATIYRKSDIIRETLVLKQCKQTCLFFLANMQSSRRCMIFSPNSFVRGVDPSQEVPYSELSKEYKEAEVCLKKMKAKGSKEAWESWGKRVLMMKIEAEKPRVQQQPVFARQVATFKS